MKKQENKIEAPDTDTNQENDTEGYPLYPPSEDIYNKFKEVKDVDPEDVLDGEEIQIIPEYEDDQVKELGDNLMGTDLDVPGSDLDDDREDTGNEDEENNYYSISGDKHSDLEEDREEYFDKL